MRGRVVRYGLVGLSGVVVNMVVLTTMRFLFPHAITLTYLAAVEASIITNYLLNARFTFKQSIHWRGIGQYNMVSAAGGVLQTTIYRLLVRQGMHYLIADLIAIPFATGFGFLLANGWVFRKQGGTDETNTARRVRSSQRTGNDR